MKTFTKRVLLIFLLVNCTVGCIAYTILTTYNHEQKQKGVANAMFFKKFYEKKIPWEHARFYDVQASANDTTINIDTLKIFK